MRLCCNTGLEEGRFEGCQCRRVAANLREAPATEEGCQSRVGSVSAMYTAMRLWPDLCQEHGKQARPWQTCTHLCDVYDSTTTHTIATTTKTTATATPTLVE